MQNVELVYGLLGFILGFLTTVAVFRARFVAIEKDVESLKTKLTDEIKRLHEDAAREWERIRSDIKQVCREDDGFRERTERRQREELLILASIARKLGAQGRVTDIGLYTDDEPGADRPSRKD